MKAQNTTAFFPGRFDPITLGHWDTAARVIKSGQADQVVVFITHNPLKNASRLFDPDVVAELTRRTVPPNYESRIMVDFGDDPLRRAIHYKAKHIVRGNVGPGDALRHMLLDLGLALLCLRYGLSIVHVRNTQTQRIRATCVRQILCNAAGAEKAKDELTPLVGWKAATLLTLPLAAGVSARDRTGYNQYMRRVLGLPAAAGAA